LVAKLRGSDGGVVWSTAFGDAGDDSPAGIVVDPKGNVVVAGSLTGPIDAGGPFGGGGSDAFVVAFDPSTGNRRWSKMIGGVGGDSGNSLSAGVDALYVTVGAGGAINYGTPLVGEANPLGAVLKMQP
jgi:outer membrane protein assembly factor BamB